MVLNIDLNALPDECEEPEVSEPPTDLQHQHPPSTSGSEPVPSATDADVIDVEAAFQTPPEWRAPRRRRTPRILIGEIVQTNVEPSGTDNEERVLNLCYDCSQTEGAAGEGLINIVCSACCEGPLIDDGPPTVREAIQFCPEKVTESSASSFSEPGENALICPVCLRSAKDPSSTTCGHVFCSKCIEEAVARLKKCPICRKSLTDMDFHKIFLHKG